MASQSTLHAQVGRGPETTSRLVVVVPEGATPATDFLSSVQACVGSEVVDALSADPPHEAVLPGPHAVLRPEPTPDAYRAAGAAAARTGEPDCLLSPVPDPLVAAFARGAGLGAQRAGTDEPAPVTVWVSRERAVAAAQRGFASATTTLLARGLANTPSSVKSPAWLAERAREIAGGGLRVVTHDEEWLHRHGFGGVLAVGAGSARPSNVTRLSLPGSGPHIVLVGKGITFDSGGLSLKPPPSMPLMKTDMSGAAAVIAAMESLRDDHGDARVTALIACAENMPGGSAMRPGDVIRQSDGRTTEILNTDAEGRLVLADCIAYAATRLHADVIVDVATLTGAATVGLGRQHAALYSPQDRLAAQLARAGDSCGEALWRMPLVSEYESAISSPLADSANTNTDEHTHAGSITAALFLQPFAHGVPWAHLDIAGTGRTESDRADCRKGATGFGAELLAQWVRGR